ncbi:hypothetical protein D3C87_1974600 [compost metagenome]
MKEFSVQTKGGKGIKYFKQGSKTGFPKIVKSFDKISQELFIETDKSSNVINLNKFTQPSTRTVIGTVFKEKINSIYPIQK